MIRTLNNRINIVITTLIINIGSLVFDLLAVYFFVLCLLIVPGCIQKLKNNIYCTYTRFRFAFLTNMDNLSIASGVVSTYILPVPVIVTKEVVPICHSSNKFPRQVWFQERTGDFVVDSSFLFYAHQSWTITKRINNKIYKFTKLPEEGAIVSSTSCFNNIFCVESSVFSTAI